MKLGMEVALSTLFYGGQGRNRTADASLFRARGIHLYVIDVMSLSDHLWLKTALLLERQWNETQFTNPSATLRCDSGTNC